MSLQDAGFKCSDCLRVATAADWAFAFDCGAAPETTVRTTPVDVYEIEKCSLELIAIVEFVKVPEMVLAVKMVKVCPMVGVKPLTNAAVNVPPRLAVPVMESWLY